MTQRLVGSSRYPGMVQLHQATPLVERQHAIIEELRLATPRYVTARQLAERTGTTIRTVQRDIARLIDAQVPITVRRGPGGGYRIDARRELPPLTLTPGEASALIASLVSLGPYTSATAATVLGKLIHTLAPPTNS
ncbi:MAG TPA: HTH domain-containing protein [Acidimicrobiia bacterium]|nr:HTH domain-containing protein [Acidimicrobiia bacterium]